MNTSSADPATVKQDLWDEFDNVERIAGGEWTNKDNMLANPCSNAKGFNYDGGRLMQGPVEDPAGFANAVAQSWRERGFTVS
ncbi:hypothetical protein M2390_002762, partial [Mycetocola sp. BIGb0189]|uniref:hypothetical protein n=1 Tax=Mycetocola sp. BIGb0189 TaxID=2940604 RepID=UPI00216706A3